jgi:hypothetical protein
MRTFTLFFSFIVCVAYAQTQVLFVEDFDYAINNSITSDGWSITGANASPEIFVSPPTISYPGYVNNGVGNEVLLSNSGQDVCKSFNTQTSGYIYASFIVNVSSANKNGDYFINLGAHPLSSYFGRVFVKKDPLLDKIAFGVQYTSGGTPIPIPSYSDYSYDLNTTYLLVLKYSFEDDISNVSIIINPSLSANEPISDWITNNQGNLSKPVNIGSIVLRQGAKTDAPILTLDGIRISKSWSDLFTVTSNLSLAVNDPKVSVVGNILSVSNVDENVLIDVYNLLGAKVLSSVLVNSTVDIGELSKGIYLVRVAGLKFKVVVN